MCMREGACCGKQRRRRMGVHLSLQGVKHRLQLGCFVRHEAHHRLCPSHAAQLVDHAEHRVELRADKDLFRAHVKT